MIVLIALGFPIALVLAWAYKVTPEGVERIEEPGARPYVPEPEVFDTKAIAVVPSSAAAVLPQTRGVNAMRRALHRTPEAYS